MENFIRTGYGKRLFEYELPEMNRNLERIAKALEKLDELSGKLCLCGPEIEPKKEPNMDIMNYPLNKIFTPRIFNSLNKINVLTLMDFLKMTKEDMLMVKGLGNKSLYVDISNFLEINRISLGMNDKQLSQIETIILPNGKELQ